MKILKITKLTILTVSVVMFSLTASAQKQSAQVTDTVVFEVGMHCHSCKNKIENTVSYEKGVKDLDVNFETKTVVVVYDKRKTTSELIKKSIEGLNYTVTEKKK